MDVMGQLGNVGSVLLLGSLSLSALGLLLQGRRIGKQEEALDEARASQVRLRTAAQGLLKLCRELRSALRAERARSRQLEMELKLWRQWR